MRQLVRTATHFGLHALQSHVLRDLRLNGQPALPAALLAQLRRTERSSPELLQVSSDERPCC